MAWLVGIVVTAMVAAFVVYRLRSAVVAKTGARTAALEELTRTGMTLEGDPLDRYTLTGQVNGIALTLENRTSILFPSAEGESVYGCVLRVPVRLPDLLVCSTSDVDGILGPVPAARRVRTGHPAFDSVFVLFVGTAASADEDRGPWGAPVLDALLDLGLRWLRVREGRAEIVFRALDEHEVHRALSLAAEVGR